MITLKKAALLFIISLLVTSCGGEESKPTDKTVEIWLLKYEGRKKEPNTVPQKIKGVCPAKIKFNINFDAIVKEKNGSIKRLKWILHSPPPHATTDIYIYKDEFNETNYIAVENIAILDYLEWSKEDYKEFHFKDRNAHCAYKQTGKDNPHFF